MAGEPPNNGALCCALTAAKPKLRTITVIPVLGLINLRLTCFFLLSVFLLWISFAFSFSVPLCRICCKLQRWLWAGFRHRSRHRLKSIVTRGYHAYDRLCVYDTHDRL